MTTMPAYGDNPQIHYVEVYFDRWERVERAEVCCAGDSYAPCRGPQGCDLARWVNNRTDDDVMGLAVSHYDPIADVTFTDQDGLRAGPVHIGWDDAGRISWRYADETPAIALAAGVER